MASFAAPILDCERTIEAAHWKRVRFLCKITETKYASGGDDGLIKFWDLETGAQDPMVLDHGQDGPHKNHDHGKGGVMCLCLIDEDNLLSGGVKNLIKHWDLKTGEVKFEYEGHDSWVMCITLFPDKKSFLCGSCDRTIRHWTVGKEECERYMIKHTQGIYGIEIIDDNTFISASADWSLKLWNFEDGTDRFASAGHDGMCKIWNIWTGECLFTLQVADHLKMKWNQRPPYRCLVKYQEGKLLSACEDKTIKMWDYETGELEQTYAGHSQAVWTILQMGDKVLSGSGDSTIKLWAPSTAELE
ncbi:hypothetical protein JL720_6850 [Aureococcus anophagefferens]|nr:hypothetical protein JL720_6850 [Aureococcus anophagefferens]